MQCQHFSIMFRAFGVRAPPFKGSSCMMPLQPLGQSLGRPQGHLCWSLGSLAQSF